MDKKLVAVEYPSILLVIDLSCHANGYLMMSTPLQTLKKRLHA